MKRYIAVSIILLLLACVMVACTGESDGTVAPLAPQGASLLPPEHVAAARTGGGDILLSWDPGTRIDLAGYNVYRGTFRQEAFSRLNAEPVVGASYVDETASANVRYEYRIVCVGSDRSESAYTAVTIYNGTGAGGEREKKIRF